MHLIQIVLVGVALAAWLLVLNSLRKGSLSPLPFVLWTALWGSVAVVAVAPDTTMVLARTLGVGRGADVAIYLAIVIAFILLFRVFGRIEDLERQITRLVRAQALGDLDRQLDGAAPPAGTDPPV